MTSVCLKTKNSLNDFFVTFLQCGENPKFDRACFCAFQFLSKYSYYLSSTLPLTSFLQQEYCTVTILLSTIIFLLLEKEKKKKQKKQKKKTTVELSSIQSSARSLALHTVIQKRKNSFQNQSIQSEDGI